MLPLDSGLDSAAPLPLEVDSREVWRSRAWERERARAREQAKGFGSRCEEWEVGEDAGRRDGRDIGELSLAWFSWGGVQRVLADVWFADGRKVTRDAIHGISELDMLMMMMSLLGGRLMSWFDGIQLRRT